MQNDIYICAQTKDAEDKNLLVSKLEEEYCILDSSKLEHILEYSNHIRQAKVFISCLTQNFLSDQSCMDQLYLAIKLNKKVFILKKDTETIADYFEDSDDICKISFSKELDDQNLTKKIIFECLK